MNYMSTAINGFIAYDKVAEQSAPQEQLRDVTIIYFSDYNLFERKDYKKVTGEKIVKIRAMLSDYIGYNLKETMDARKITAFTIIWETERIILS